MFTIFGIISITALLSYLICLCLCHYAQWLDLIVTPNTRSSHSKPTAQGGGLGIVVSASLLGACTAIYVFNSLTLLYLFILALPLAVTGFLDDRYGLSARLRLFVQCLSVLALLVFIHLSLASSPTLTLPIIFLYLALLIGLIWWINLFNFMDGIDGIAASQAVFMLLAAVVLVFVQSKLPPTLWPQALNFPLAGEGKLFAFSPLNLFAEHGILSHSEYILSSLIVASATLGFLILNWPPAKIFMGDVGSTWLAFMIAAFALLAPLSCITWLILAAVFVTDASFTLLVRLLQRKPFYQAHRDHAYQKLARRFGQHRSVTLIVSTINFIYLLPLALATIVWPTMAGLFLLLAYTPLVFAVYVLRAGSDSIN